MRIRFSAKSLLSKNQGIYFTLEFTFSKKRQTHTELDASKQDFTPKATKAKARSRVHRGERGGQMEMFKRKLPCTGRKRSLGTY